MPRRSPRGLASRRKSPNLLVVGVAGSNCLLKDARVRCHAAQAILFNQAPQLTAAHQLPTDEVQPDTLALCQQGRQLVGDVVGSGLHALYLARPRWSSWS